MALYTINREVKNRLHSPLILDLKGRRYKSNGGEITFPAPELWTLEKNLFYLLGQSKEIDLLSKYHMRPSYLAYDEYGTVVLGDFLMYVNGVDTIEQFVMQKVLVPSKNAVVRICQDNYSIDPTYSQTVKW